MEYLFIIITPRSTLTQSGSTCYGPIYGGFLRGGGGAFHLHKQVFAW